MAAACRCSPTATLGEFVAGVRYRAWQPPSCLHPTIPVDTPLVFDLFDTWNDRSIGGCTYHVSHPGGLSYETFPVNAMEAETRRVSRFFPHGHTPGSFSLPPSKPIRSFRARWICGAAVNLSPQNGRGKLESSDTSRSPSRVSPLRDVYDLG